MLESMLRRHAKFARGREWREPALQPPPPLLPLSRHPPIAPGCFPDHQIEVLRVGEVPHSRVLHTGRLGRAHDIIELRAALPELQHHHRADRHAENAAARLP